ncbi:DUF1569 domain-containing protein [Flavobacterium sp. MAH-1]|uniref:DUF1569 domain-containing protein n=1 Tax=Flavobacterium agri TaxID=2743471 RepID=A0A7Y8Y0A8_9FLAO|nr:DUF1569 domain-containing protein [Flavobacterium agri]NUY80216.1 DUF1569 domain-containing protein [Flavobacterium agri]NYA70241.1 DUF1569 domain-containing protein [Flavobacterium agri]
MKSIFNQETNAELLERLSKITAQTVPNWGKMNASQMVTHCQKPLDVAEGTLKLPHSFIGKLFGKMVKKQFLSGKPISKNSPTAKEFVIKGTPDFEKEKSVLEAQIRKFGEKGPDAVANKTHPFFGTMTDDEWGKLHYVHLDHHFTQFGV